MPLLKVLQSAYAPLFVEMTPIEIFTVNNGWALIDNNDYTIEEFIANTNGDGCEGRSVLECAKRALETGVPCAIPECMWGVFALVLQESMTTYGMRIKDLVYFTTSSQQLPLPEKIMSSNIQPLMQINFNSGSEYSRLPTSSTCFIQLKLPWGMISRLISAKTWTEMEVVVIRTTLAEKLALAACNSCREMGFA